MPSKATRYSISFKKEAVLNYLQFKISSPNASMNHFLTKFNVLGLKSENSTVA